MDVGGVRGQRALDQQVDEPDHRSLEGHVAEVVDVLLGLGMMLGGRTTHALDDFLQGGIGAVGPLDGVQDGRGRRHAQLDRQAEQLLEIIEQLRVGRIRRGHRDRAGLDRDGAGDVLAQVLGRQLLERGRGRGQLVSGQERHALLGGQRPEDVGRGGGTHGHQGLTQVEALPQRPGHGLPQDVRGDHAFPGEDLAEAKRVRLDLQGVQIVNCAETCRQSSRSCGAVLITAHSGRYGGQARCHGVRGSGREPGMRLPASLSGR